MDGDVGAGASLREGTVVLVEGVSDRIALETLAARRRLDLDSLGVALTAVGGAQAVARTLAGLAPGVRVGVLCDAGEEAVDRRALERVGTGSRQDALQWPEFFVCERDLEDELIHTLGAETVQRLLEKHGDLRAFRTLQREPEWRGRPVEEQLRRFLGSGASRKTRYARILVEALDLERVPRPLDAVLAYAIGGAP